MFRLSAFSRQKSRSADDIKIVIDLVDDTDDQRSSSDIPKLTAAILTTKPTSHSPKKRLQGGHSLLKAEHEASQRRRKSLDVGVQADRKPLVNRSPGSLVALLAMKKSDQKPGAAQTKGIPKLLPGHTSPLASKKLLLPPESGSQGLPASVSGSSGISDHSTTPGASSEDLVENGSDPGTDDVDGGDNSSRTRQLIDALGDKIQKTKEAIRREQTMKEEIVNEYLQMATEKQPTARIKALFEKKNQKSAQTIIHLQRKLDNYQQRLKGVETRGYTGHKQQAMEVLRDVGQGLNTIVSKPKEFAHLFKHKFGSADNISQLKLEDSTALEVTPNGKTGTTLLASSKYMSDDEASSITSGSGPRTGPHLSPHHMTLADSSQTMTLNHSLLTPITTEITEVKDMTHRVNDILLRLVEEFEGFKIQMETDVSLLRSQLDDEKYRTQCLEEQLNDLTELHQHEMMNLRQDLTSMEEKIEYRLDERTTDLSDLMDNVSTRISRLEQLQQQQQILSMEMVENATFRTVISKLINVVLAILAVILVFVSTSANFLSPFVNSTSRLVVSLLMVLITWLLYQNYPHMQGMALSLWDLMAWPWR